MNELNIDTNWNFEQAVNNLKALREQYEGILSSFLYFQLHEKVEFKRRTRDAFYSLNCQEWQMNKLWEYMNGNEYLYVLKGIVKRQKEKEKNRCKK